MGRLLRDLRDHLDRGRPRPDHGDALAREVDALPRPERRQVRLGPANVSTPSNSSSGRFGSDRQPVAMTQKRAVHSLAVVRADAPAPRGLVEHGSTRPGSRTGCPAQVEPVGDVVDVGEDLGLRRVPLRPLHSCSRLGRESVRVLHALDVAARAGVAVPVPRASDPLAGLEDARRQALPRNRWSR